MEMSLEKCNSMVNEFSNIHANVITMNTFKYMGATLTKYGKNEKEIKIRFGSGKPNYNM